MYNSKYIWAGIIVFLGLFTMPLWLNFGSAKYERPVLALPAKSQAAECVEPAAFMAAEHMQLLDTWRDMALRQEKRVYVSSTGKEWTISLQNTCMSCHADKKNFCDKCHDSNSVRPYCWDCHVAPGESK